MAFMVLLPVRCVQYRTSRAAGKALHPSAFSLQPFFATMLSSSSREDVMEWDIRREGRAWGGAEGYQRFTLTPEKFELIGGKLFWSEEDRVNLLGLLLENVGADRAVRLGDPRVWMEAVEGLRSVP
jgi:hypothetical protein